EPCPVVAEVVPVRKGVCGKVPHEAAPKGRGRSEDRPRSQTPHPVEVSDMLPSSAAFSKPGGALAPGVGKTDRADPSGQYEFSKTDTIASDGPLYPGLPAWAEGFERPDAFRDGGPPAVRQRCLDALADRPVLALGRRPADWLAHDLLLH